MDNCFLYFRSRLSDWRALRKRECHICKFKNRILKTSPEPVIEMTHEETAPGPVIEIIHEETAPEPVQEKETPESLEYFDEREPPGE